MKRYLASTVFALALAGTAAWAGDFGDAIRAAYTSAGYANIEVRQVDGRWLVTADRDGGRFRFIVDEATGQSAQVADNSAEAGLFDAGATGTGVSGGLVNGAVAGVVSGQNTGMAGGGDDESGEHEGTEHEGSGSDSESE